MIVIEGLDHLVIRARDAARLLAFYRDVLGCTLERTVADAGLYQLRAGRSLIDIVAADGELGRRGGPPPGAGGNLDHFCVRVANFDPTQIRAHLARHGVEAGAAALRYGADGWGPSIYLSDPEGNGVELKGPPQSGPGSGKPI